MYYNHVYLELIIKHNITRYKSCIDSDEAVVVPSGLVLGHTCTWECNQEESCVEEINKYERLLAWQSSSFLTKLTWTRDLNFAGLSSSGHSDFLMLC